VERVSPDRTHDVVAAKEVDIFRMTDFAALPLFLKAEDLAEILRTTTKAIYAMAARGSLPGTTRIGRRLLFRRDDLVRWLNESRAPSPEENRR